MMFGYEMNWMMWLFGSLTVAGVVVLIIVVVLATTGRFGANSPLSGGTAGPQAGAARSRARQILDERFARGDLSADQYSEHLRILGED